MCVSELDRDEKEESNVSKGNVLNSASSEIGHRREGMKELIINTVINEAWSVRVMAELMNNDVCKRWKARQVHTVTSSDRLLFESEGKY